MLNTIQGFYINIKRAKARAAAVATEVEAEVADAERHVTALTAGLLDHEKAKLDAWLKEHDKGRSVAVPENPSKTV